MHPQQQLTHYNETASQTGGPYVHIGLAPQQAGFDIFENNFGNVLAQPGTPGERIVVEGTVYDGLGLPMRDVLLEIWQADAEGHYAHPADPKPSAFRGWGRTGADFETGVYRFETIKPGAVALPDGRLQAPHIAFWIVARGINLGLHTRLYFGDEAEANAKDPVLTGIEWATRRKTLVAAREQRGGATVYRFDIRIQGQGGAEDQETVFFDV
ncbi:protocatechuate 3,4-dioxygenase subunit alpha [Aquincola sp. MAHUQ-54]|uniref:Protocatechuate 3,4-dioxygenase subunit alpha n=1 Tax=Aquincola agrisoli TaxID=3119538 RepID=A0AAW9QG20_9BURK